MTLVRMEEEIIVEVGGKNTMQESKLSDWEEQQAKNAHHRALIMRILKDHPKGLTTQQIIIQEQEYYGYIFLSDNRLRELRVKGWVKCEGEKPMKWFAILEEAEQNE